jgi:hypothetical protein
LTNPTIYKTSWRMNARDRARLQWLVVAIIAILFFFIVLKPWITSLEGRRNFQSCQTNMLKMARAVNTYANDWDGAFPPAETWMANLAGQMTATSGTGFDVLYYFHCPEDHSGSKFSYAYNDLMSGLLPTVKPREGDVAEKKRREALGRVNRAPLIIERHRSNENAHVRLETWNDVKREMTLPHVIPEPTGWMITGTPEAISISDEKLRDLLGKRF